jgi:hypothetical protein
MMLLIPKDADMPAREKCVHIADETNSLHSKRFQI